IIFVHLCGNHRDILPFPTRRSSDLEQFDEIDFRDPLNPEAPLPSKVTHLDRSISKLQWHLEAQVEKIERSADVVRGADATETGRSEEHTSELQSRFDLVCRLLLEKK